jgi:hypothetical protein
MYKWNSNAREELGGGERYITRCSVETRMEPLTRCVPTSLHAMVDMSLDTHTNLQAQARHTVTARTHTHTHTFTHLHTLANHTFPAHHPGSPHTTNTTGDARAVPRVRGSLPAVLQKYATNEQQPQKAVSGGSQRGARTAKAPTQWG